MILERMGVFPPLRKAGAPIFPTELRLSVWSLKIPLTLLGFLLLRG